MQGDTVELSNFLVEPLEAKFLPIGVAYLYEIRRKVLDRVRHEVSTYLEIEGDRVTGANPFRQVRIRRKA